MPAEKGTHVPQTAATLGVNWKLAGVDITYGIITDYDEQCEHNADCVHSELELAAGRAMNGEELRCELIYEEDTIRDTVVVLNIYCE